MQNPSSQPSVSNAAHNPAGNSDKLRESRRASADSTIRCPPQPLQSIIDVEHMQHQQFYGMPQERESSDDIIKVKQEVREEEDHPA